MDPPPIDLQQIWTLSLSKEYKGFYIFFCPSSSEINTLTPGTDYQRQVKCDVGIQRKHLCDQVCTCLIV